MHERVKTFLDTKKAEKNNALKEKKDKLLIDLGLFEKVYTEKEDYSPEFPHSDYDQNNKVRWYRKEALPVTDEEFEEIKKYSKTEGGGGQSFNPVATLLRIIAVVVYLAGFFISSSLGVDRYGDLSAMFFAWFSGFFVCGTIVLGFAEIIQLLHDIKNK